MRVLGMFLKYRFRIVFLQIGRFVKLKRSYMPQVPDMHRAGIGLGQWLQMSYSKGGGGGRYGAYGA